MNQAPSTSPTVSSDQQKFQIKNWAISTLVISLIIIFIFCIYLIISQLQSNPKITNQLASQIPTSTTKTIESANIAIAFIKDGDIYVADYNGDTSKIFELNLEEIRIPKKLYMKLSPDKKYLAYLGVSGGLDSALKIIDIQQKRKLSQQVYGTASIADFAWSPDSDQIVVAVNLKNEEQSFTTSLYVIDPFNQNIGSRLFKSENIEITQVEWPDDQNIYYARIAYAPVQNTGIVGYNFETKSRIVRTIKPTNDVYKNISIFTINFLISSDKKEIMVYVRGKDEPNIYRRSIYNLQAYNIPSLVAKTVSLNQDLSSDAIWYKNHLIDIEKPYESPDSSLVLINLPQEKDRLSLLEMGPSGSFHSVKIINQNETPILMVWLEFDQQQLISAYDLDACIELRKAISSGPCQPLWKITDSSSLDL